MTIHVSIDDMSTTKSRESKPSRSASPRRRSRGNSQVLVMPSTGILPEFVDMGVDATKNDVLSTGKHVSGSLVIGVGCAGGIGQVVVMRTATLVPSKLVHMV